MQAFNRNDTRQTETAVEKMRDLQQELRSAEAELDEIKRQVMQECMDAGIPQDVMAEVWKERWWSL